MIDINIAAMLLGDRIKTIEVTFDKVAPETSLKLYTYLAPLSVQEGQRVCVKVGEDFRVVYVRKVHEELMIQPGDQVKYKPIAGLIDFDAGKDLSDMLAAVDTTVRTAYHNKARRAFRDTVIDELPQDTRDALLTLLK